KAPEAEATEEASTEKAPEAKTTEEVSTEEKAQEVKTTEEVSTEEKAPEAQITEEASEIVSQPTTVASSIEEKSTTEKTSYVQSNANNQLGNFTEEDLTNEVNDKITNLSDADRKQIITNAKIDYSKDSIKDARKKIALEAIRYAAEKIDKNKVPATTTRNYTGFRAASMVDSNAEVKGENVNDKIVIDKFNFDKRTFDPNQSGYTNMNVSFRVTDSIKEGDYFTFDVPNNLSLDGDIDYSKVGDQMGIADLKNANGDIIATGTYNTKTKQGKYTFTNFVNEKENVKGGFETPVFTDRKVSPRSGNYPVSFNIAGKQFNTTINLNHSSPFVGAPGPNGANVSSFINKIDNSSGERTYKQVIYVNSLRKQLYGANVNVKGYYDNPDVSSTLVNSDDTSYKIYEVINPNQLNESYYVDPNNGNFKDVTTNFKNYITDNNDNSMDIRFGDINKAYVILVDGHYDDSDKDVLTRVTQTNRNYYGTPSSFYWDNRNILKAGSGNGDGENRPKFNLGDYVWEDTNKDGVQGEDEKG
ncbi:fibrinogen-binding adhesin SdrG C-terminal domain-containing protein, partial [Mammaliicoccus sciuri]|uniref:fibrinogen-binding adhesin SdrG C-terminal domain-containing protein n=1 Tax=Mammaliicoccus sciuri TaxID=1296 RepID=UPI0037C86158